MMVTDQINIIKDVSLLYELSLAVGSSLDFNKNCDRFLSTLISRKNLSYASVWIHGSFLNQDDQGKFYMRYAYPEFRVRERELPLDHSILQALSKEKYVRVSSNEEHYSSFSQEEDLESGTYTIFRLGDLGFLKIHEFTTTEPENERELNQLTNVLEKFTVSIAACLSHMKYKEMLSRQKSIMSDLQESKEKYQNVVENLSEGLVLTDMEEQIIFVNPRFAEISGYAQEEMIGKRMTELFVGKENSDLFTDGEEQDEDGLSESYVSHLVRKDGSQRWASVMSSPYKISSGDVIGSISAVADITEQRRVEEAMKENDGKIRAIIDSSLDAVLVIDQKGKVNEWNKRAEEIFGWKREEVKGVTLSETIIPYHLRDAHEAGMKKFLSTGDGPVLNQRIEIFGMDRNDREFPIELTICPIKMEDKYFFSAFIRDITERKEAEEKREKILKKLASANAELKDFAYVVSHDLKAPLRAISSLAAWIEEDYEENFDENGKEQLRLLRGRVSRMGELISGILDYSRVGRTNTGIKEVDLQKTVNQILDMLSPPPQFTITVQQPLPLVLYNEVSIQQVFQNLLSNAIKYNDKERGMVELGYDQSDDEFFKFWVKDNGPGIAEKYHKKIFKIFQTLRPRDEREATGVGLSIVKKIIQLFGGEIWVESEIDKGSTFYFTVPKVPKELNVDLV